MSKYLKYFLIFIIILFCNFIVSTSLSKFESKSKEEKITEKKIIETEKEAIPLTTYPIALTKKVSKKLDSAFTRFNKRNGFHGSVLVAKDGKLIFSNQYGYADFKNKTELDENSVFQLASVSKQFTAAAIMILYERNQLNLDDLVTKYFSDFPYEDVTIRHLLNHTSGLPKYFWLAEHKWEKDNAPSNDEMMDMLAEHKLQRFFKPGRNFDYSNTGYFVLASIVEKVSDKEFGQFLKENVFDPLQMDRSFVYRFEIDSINDNQLDGYRLYRRRYHAPIGGTVNDAIVGDKNVYSTSEDMLKWINGLNSGEIISKESVDMMYTKGETKYGRKVPYGFGFRIDDRNSEKIVYHHGKWNGFSTSITQYSDSDLVIIVLEHTKYNSMKYLNKKIQAIVNENFKES